MGKPSEHTRSKGRDDRFREEDLLRIRRAAHKSIQKPIKKSKHRKPTNGNASTATNSCASITADTFADGTANTSTERSASANISTGSSGAAQTKSSTEICRPYLTGDCSGHCLYAHPPICRKHLRGKCYRKCKYVHLTDPATFEHHLHLLDIEKEGKDATAQKAAMENKEVD